MAKKYKNKSPKQIHIHYTDISENPAYNKELQPESEITLEETLDWIFEEDEKAIRSEEKTDEDK
jgi:hypothetical protein